MKRRVWAVRQRSACLAVLPGGARLGALALALWFLGGPVPGARGFTLGAGDILVGNDGNGTVIKVDPVTGEQTRLGTFRGVHDLALAPNGRLYVLEHAQTVSWLDIATGATGEVSSEGLLGLKSLDTFVPGLCYGPDGMLYVSVYTGPYTAIVRIDPVTGNQTSFATTALVKGPVGIEWAPDGLSLVVADIAVSQLSLVRTNGTSVAKLASGLGTGSPWGIAVDASGGVYFGNSADSPVKQIRYYDPVTKVVRVVSKDGLLKNPYDVAIEPGGKLIVSQNDPTLVRVDPATGTQSIVSSGGMLAGSLSVIVSRVEVPLSPQVVPLPAGSFVMGSPATEPTFRPSEGPQTTVTLSRPFSIGKYEVTQGEYLSVIKTNPSAFRGDLSRPVESVSWNEAVEYCRRLSLIEHSAGRLAPGLQYRLPTEAEWEYACRAGTTTRFPHGDDPGYLQLPDYAWENPNSGGTTHPVGGRSPNAWGLFDMMGNVQEMTSDWAGGYAGGSVTDPVGAPGGTYKMVRSGDWNDFDDGLRSAVRYSIMPDQKFSEVGFRVVLAEAGSDPAWTQVYTNDFETSVKAFWTATAESTTPNGKRRFLGPFANRDVRLKLTNMPPHSLVTINFDLLIIGTWDGASTSFGPDVWSLRTLSGRNLINTTFSNGESDTALRQSYPSAYPGGTSPGTTGAAERGTLGYASGYTGGVDYGDSVYRLSATFTNNSAEETFVFAYAPLGGTVDETWGLDNVSVQVGNPAGASISVGLPVYDADEGQTNAVVTVVRYGDSSAAASVDYFTTQATALADRDYRTTSGTVTFAPGEISKNILVPVLEDTEFEDLEFFQFTLMNPSPGVALGPLRDARVQILDNEGFIEFSRTNLVVDELAGWAQLPIRRTRSVSSPASVRLRTFSGTATVGTDLFSYDTRVNFTAGQASQVFQVALKDDLLPEDLENFTVELSEPSSGTALTANSRINVWIADDDQWPGTSRGASWQVSSTLLQPDGRIVLGGNFLYVNGAPRTRLARLNPDGSLDAGFAPSAGFNADVRALALQDDGSIVCGGTFTTLGSTTLNRIARILPNGTLDASFKPGTGMNGAVQELAIQPDGRILVAGGFTKVNGANRVGVARLNPDGSLDNGLDPGAGATEPPGNPTGTSTVSAMALQADGKVVVSGSFSKFGGVARQQIARLNADGTVDGDFHPAFNGGCTDIVQAPDGKLLLVGAFTTINGTTRNRIARLNADGSLDATFNAGTGPDEAPSKIRRLVDGRLLVVGSFYTWNGAAHSGIVRLNEGGGLDSTFGVILGISGHPQDALPGCWDLEVLADGSIFAAGSFTRFEGIPSPGFAFLDSEGRTMPAVPRWFQWRTSGGGDGHWYALTDRGVTWASAESEAAGYGGHLAAVHTAAKEQFLVDTFLKGPLMNRPLWIGFSDSAKEGTFVWSDGSPVDYTDWYPGEPNDSQGEDFTVMNWHFSADHGASLPMLGAWNDVQTAVSGNNIPWYASSGPFQGIMELPLDPVLQDVSGTVWYRGGQGRWGESLDPDGSGGSVLRSGPIGSNERSSVQTLVDGPARVGFGWKVSSLKHDNRVANGADPEEDSLSIFIDATELRSISGKVPWEAQSYSVPAGRHWIRFVYRHRGQVASGWDAGWIRDFAVDHSPDAARPRINREPQDQILATTRGGSLVVSASGADPLAYQWWHNGTVIAGATNPVLTLASVGLPAGGGYSVSVSNSAGTVESRTASIRVVTDNTPSELARFSLTGNALDSLGKSPPGDVDGVTFDDGRMGLNGLFENRVINTLPEPYRARFSIIGLNYDAFAVRVDVTPETLADSPILLGGAGYAWFGLRMVGGRPALTLNNGAFLHAYASGEFHAGAWNTVVCSVDIASRKIVTVLNGHRLEDVALPADLVLGVDVPGNPYAARERLFTFTDYAAGTAFQGSVRDLRVFARPLSDDELAWATLAAAAPRVLLNGNPVTGPTAVSTGPAIVELALDLEGGLILYTLDGTDPVAGRVYTGPFTVTDFATVRALAYFSDSFETAGTGPVSITVAAPPWILTAPSGTTVAAGQPVVFSVTGTGPGPIDYQWYRGQEALDSATLARLDLGPASPGLSGDYTVVLRNSHGFTTSQVARLDVRLRPGLAHPLAGQLVVPGSDVDLCADATGSQPLAYQWRRNGLNLPDETNTCLTLPGIQPADGGAYSVVIANDAGVFASDPALVQVPVTPAGVGDRFVDRVPLTLLAGTVSGSNTLATADAGEPAHAGKPGGKSIWYRWTPSRTGIATIDTRGSSFDTLLAVYTGSSVAALQVVGSDEDSGGFYTSRLKIPVVAGVEYSIAVDGYAGASGQVVLSWSLDPSTDVLPRIVTPPVSVAATLGGEAQFSVVAVPAGVTFQWFFKGAAIAGATASTLQVTPVGYRDVGAYTVQVQGGPGRVVLSEPVNLEVGPESTVVTYDKLQDLLNAPPPGVPVLSGGGPSDGYIALRLGTRGSQLLNNTGSGTQAGEPNHCNLLASGRTRWFGLRVTTNGVVAVDTLGSSIDTVMAVYRWVADIRQVQANLVTCDEDPGVFGSQLRFEVTDAPRDFLVAVDSVGPAITVSHGDGTTETGLIHMNWSMGLAPVVTGVTGGGVAVSGETRVLEALAQAQPPGTVLGYRWRVNGQDLAGGGQSKWVLTGVGPAQAGVYEVEVSNEYGVARGSARLDVMAAPPRTWTVEGGGKAVLGAVLASADTGCVPQYAWYYNGKPLAGQTAPLLSLGVADLGNAGPYSVRVTTCAGVSTTLPAGVLAVSGKVEFRTGPLGTLPAFRFPPISDPVCAVVLETMGEAVDANPAWVPVMTNTLPAAPIQLELPEGFQAEPGSLFRARILTCPF